MAHSISRQLIVSYGALFLALRRFLRCVKELMQVELKHLEVQRVRS